LTVLDTGGAGFIGANFVPGWLRVSDKGVVSLDKLTYAGNLGNLTAVADHPSHHCVKRGTCDQGSISDPLNRFDVRAIVHLAAEGHVDRSIHGLGDFIRTNVTGNFSLH